MQKMKNKIFNVGIFSYIGIKSRTLVYNYWFSMLRRCYSEKSLLKDSQYKDCYVCEDWKHFKMFVEWYKENWKPHMEGWQLDKDVLIKNNKIYSPDTCAFVPQEINKLFTKRNIVRGEFPLGVTKSNNNKFLAQLSTKHNKNKSRKIGYYNTPEEAFQAYKEAKERYIKEVANEWKEQIDPRVYEAMYNYQVEIDD